MRALGSDDAFVGDTRSVALHWNGQRWILMDLPAEVRAEAPMPVADGTQRRYFAGA